MVCRESKATGEPYSSEKFGGNVGKHQARFGLNLPLESRAPLELTKRKKDLGGDKYKLRAAVPNSNHMFNLKWNGRSRYNESFRS